MVTTTRRRVTAASPARWAKALERAIAEGVQVRQLATSGVWVATSGTQAGLAYVVTGDGCECRAAAEGDAVCKHRALFWYLMGILDRPEPEPPTPAAPAAPAAGRRAPWEGLSTDEIAGLR